MLKTIRKIWLGLFVVVAIAAIVVLLTQESSRITIPRIVSARYLAAAGAAQVIFWILATKMWNNVTLVVANTRLSFWASFRQLALVGLGKYLPGKIWGILARGSQMTTHGISVQNAAVATFFEQFILFHSAAVLCAILFAVQRQSVTALLLAAVAVVSIVLGSVFSTIAVRCGGWLAEKVGLGFAPSDLAPIRSADYLRLSVGYALIWILSGLVFLCLYRTFFASEIDLATASGLVMANAIAIALGFFALFAPGAIGVREAIAVSVLTAYIPLAEAVVLVVIFRLWTTLMDAIAGVTVLAGRSRTLPQ